MTQEPSKPVVPATVNAPELANRLDAGQLSEIELAMLKLLIRRERERRGVYENGILRICIDGRECLRCSVKKGLLASFKLPVDAAYIEVFGRDNDGEYCWQYCQYLNYSYPTVIKRSSGWQLTKLESRLSCRSIRSSLPRKSPNTGLK